MSSYGQNAFNHGSRSPAVDFCNIQNEYTFFEQPSDPINYKLHYHSKVLRSKIVVIL